MKTKSISIFIVCLFFATYTVFSLYETNQKKNAKQFQQELKQVVRDKVSNGLRKEKKFLKNISYDEENFKIKYTVNRKLQLELEKVLKRYPSDHSSVVVLNNDTGGILAVAGVRKNGREINYTLPFSSTHPSASLFKVVTSADLIENNGLFPEKVISFKGRGTTLYKNQLNEKVSRWMRKMSFKKAFAFSNNVIFGKTAINESNALSLFKTANKFGFNRPLMKDIDLGVSHFEMPTSDYNLAELASGFNKKTQISPVHAALLSSVVVNNGIMPTPHIIKNVTGDEHSYKVTPKMKRVLTKKTANSLKVMMVETVKKGTARRIIKGKKGKRLDKEFDIGAKTGSITGGVPFGKRDWLTLYANPKKSLSKGVSISVMNVNVKKWYYKSTFIAQKVLNHIRSLDKKEFEIGEFVSSDSASAVRD